MKKIESYIKNIDSFSDPKEEGKNVANSILELNEKYLTNIYVQIQKFKIELEKIKSDLTENIKI